jgi:ATP-dependent DNA helicase RecG
VSSPPAFHPFANAQGGKFFIGIDDNGKIIGVENSKKLLESLPSKIRDAMGIVVDINLVPIYICVSNTKTV